MKTKKIITKSFLVLIVSVSFYLHSCEREGWCVDCKWVCDVKPIGSDSRTFCADSPEECQARVKEFMDHRVLPDCWECGDPYED